METTIVWGRHIAKYKIRRTHIEAMEGRMCQHVGLEPKKFLSCTRTLHKGWARAPWQLQMSGS